MKEQEVFEIDNNIYTNLFITGKNEYKIPTLPCYAGGFPKSCSQVFTFNLKNNKDWLVIEFMMG